MKKIGLFTQLLLETINRHIWSSLPPTNVVCEGYVFTRVCHSAHRGVCMLFLAGGASMLFFRGACMLFFGGHACFFGGACMLFFQGACMLFSGGHACFFPGGMHAFFWGGMHAFFRGACVLFSGGHACFFWGRACFFSGDTVNERAVRILLECILVIVYFFIVFYLR